MESGQAAGISIDVKVQGPVRALPPAVDATAYRIVQEAVTNVLRHAERANMEVAVRYAENQLYVQIEDDGGSGAASTGPGGYGLVGIRERVAVFDGQLEAGPRADGPGWRLTAVLPLEPTG